MLTRILTCAAAVLSLAACAKTAEAPAAPPAEAAAPSAFDPDRLDALLTTLPAAEQARFTARHPKEMLGFFGIAPGMTVVEVLPGGGWWTRILLPYLGAGGRLVGADYPLDMWAKFGEYAPNPDEQRKWPTEWPVEAASWCATDCARIEAFAFGGIPESIKGRVDAVLMFRALHHLSRLDDAGGFYGTTLKETFDLLKPGGVVGVEQHRAPAGNSDAWADGENGYLKQDAVIARFVAAGFEFVASSEVNANPKDRPTEQDFVWRLPPSLQTSAKDPALKAQMEAIGESDRMTLLFRKPV